jgi:flagellar motility protein MotE (MotC chaperone)
MTKLEAIEEEIKKLSVEELAELRDWLAEHDWAEWDKQIERDAASGKLEKLFTKARADHAAGKSTKL